MKQTSRSTATTDMVIACLNSGIEAIMYVLVGALPFIYIAIGGEEYEFPKISVVYLLTIILLGLVAVKWTLLGRIPLPQTVLTRPILIYLALFILATVFSTNIYTSLTGFYGFFDGGLLSLLCYIIIGSVLLTYEQRQSLLPRLLLVWLIASTLISLIAILQHFGIDLTCLASSTKHSLFGPCWSYDNRSRVDATIGQPNFLAAYLVASLPLGWLALVRASNRYERSAAFISAIAGYSALWFTYSRAGLIGLAIAGILFAIALSKRTWSSHRWLFIGYFVACLFVSVLNWQAQTARWSTDQFTSQESTIQTRAYVWEGAIQVIAHHPLLGTGPETFTWAFLPYRPTGLNQTVEWNAFYTRAHNEVLNQAATIGIPGALAFLAIFIALLIYCWRTVRLPLFCRFQRPNLPADLEISTLTASIFGVFVCQLFGFATVLTSLLCWLSLAMIVSQSSQTKSLKIATKTRQLAWMAFAVVVIITGGYCWQAYVRAEFIEKAPVRASLTPTQAENDYRQAIDLNPYEPSYQLSLAFLLTNRASQAKQGPDQNNLILQANQVALTAYNLNPDNPLSLRDLMIIYNDLGKIDPRFYRVGQSVAESQVVLSPTDPNGYQNLALMDAQLGKTDQAKSQLQKAITLRPVADNYWKLAQFEQSYGSQGQYRQAVSQTLDIDPTYASAVAARKSFE